MADEVRARGGDDPDRRARSRAIDRRSRRGRRATAAAVLTRGTQRHRLRRAPGRPRRGDDRRRRTDAADRAVPRRLLHARRRTPATSCAGSSTRCPTRASRSSASTSRKRIDGEVWAGPNAVLAFAREGYRAARLSARATSPGRSPIRGFLAAGRPVLRTGLAEMWRDWSKPAFVARAAALRAGDPRRPARLRAIGRPGPGASRATARWSTTSGSAARAACSTSGTRRRPRPRSLAIGRVLATAALERLAGVDAQPPSGANDEAGADRRVMGDA